MRTAIAVLPFFADFNPIPPLGLACLSAYVRQAGVSLDVLDLTTKAIGYHPRLFPMLGQQGDLPDLAGLPLLCLLVEKFRAGRILAYLVEPNPKEPALVNYAIEQGLSPSASFQEIQYMHAFVRTYSHVFLKYDVVAFSLLASNLYVTILMAMVLRAWKPGVKIVVGGPQATQSEWTCRFLLEFGVVDAIVRGEGERSFLTLLQTLQQGGNAEGQLGVMTRAGEGGYHYAPAPIIHDLDALPTPDFSQFQLADYTPFTLPIYSSRGCPFSCAFCAEHDMLGGYRRRSPGRVLEDMRSLKTRYRAHFFRFADSLLNTSEAWLDEFAERLAADGLDVHWRGFFRATMDESLAAKLRRAGLESVAIGAESFSDQVLDSMGKRRAEADNIEAVRVFMACGIHTRINIVVGFPGETHAMFRHTLDQVEYLWDTYVQRSAPPYLGMAVEPFRVLPNSRIYAAPGAFGVELKLGLGDGYAGALSNDIVEFASQIPTTFSIAGLPLAEVQRRYQILNSLAAQTNFWGAYAPALETIVGNLRPSDRLILGDSVSASVLLRKGMEEEVFELKLPNDKTTLALDRKKWELVRIFRGGARVADALNAYALDSGARDEVMTFVGTLLRNKILRFCPPADSVL